MREAERKAKHYGFTGLDLIINYGIKHRVGGDLNAGE